MSHTQAEPPTQDTGGQNAGSRMRAENMPFLMRPRNTIMTARSKTQVATDRKATGMRVISTTNECKKQLDVFSLFGMQMMTPLGKV